jgi:hypothetical protein
MERCPRAQVADGHRRAALLCGRYVGTGWEGIDNEDDAITNAPLRDLPAARVVRFRVSAARAGAPRGGGGAGAPPGRELVHGYDAVALARWLARDARLPLTVPVPPPASNPPPPPPSLPY